MAHCGAPHPSVRQTKLMWTNHLEEVVRSSAGTGSVYPAFWGSSGYHTPRGRIADVFLVNPNDFLTENNCRKFFSILARLPPPPPAPLDTPFWGVGVGGWGWVGGGRAGVIYSWPAAATMRRSRPRSKTTCFYMDPPTDGGVLAPISRFS